MARTNRQDLFLSIRGDVTDLRTATAAGKTVLNEFGGTAINVLEQVEKKFGEIGAGGLPDIKRTEQAYIESFKRIRDAANAASGTDGASAIGILDANASRQAAEAATVRAAALREVAEAASRADAAEGGASAATRAYAVAASTAAIDAERVAEGLRAQAGVLSTIERQLGTTATAQRRAVVISGEQRAGYQQLSYQLGDISTQYALGASASQIFAAQSAQVVQALQLIGGEGNKVLGFLGGPWGIAITSAVVALTPFVAKLLESNDAIEKGVSQLKTQAAESDASARAKDRFANSVEGVSAALKDQRKVMDDAEKAEQSAAETTNINARATFNKAVATREATKASLQQAIAEAKIAGTIVTPGANGESAAAVEARRRVEALEKQLAEATKSADQAIIDLNRSRIDLAAELADRMSDPMKRIKKFYDDQREAVKAAAEEAGRHGRRVTISVAEQIAAINRLEQAAVKTEQDRQDAERRNSRTSGTLTTFGQPVDGARRTGSFGERRSDHNHQGIDYAVPVGTPVRATAAGAIKFAGERGGYGNLIIVNNGAGTETRFGHLSKIGVQQGQQVAAGDVIGYSGGAPGSPGAGRTSGPHLHYEVRRGGRAVDPFKARFPTDQGAVEDAAASASERLAREREAAERKREVDERKRIENADAYQQLLDQVEGRRLDIARSRVLTIEEAAALDVQQVERGRQDVEQAAQKGVLLGRWTQAQADAVKTIALENSINEQLAIRRREDLARVNRQFEIDQSALAERVNLLRLDGELAKTAGERRAIARQLLAFEQQQVEEALRNRIKNEADPDRRADLQRQLDGVGGEYSRRRAILDQEQGDPLQRYGRDLQRSVGDMDEAMQNVKADGLRELEDGLVGVINGTESVAGAFKSMAASIIADLARIAVRKLILNTLGSSFFGLADGGAIADVPAYADGGLITGPGTGRSDSILALVGGRKPIRVSNGEAIVNERGVRNHWPLIKAINEDRLPKFADGGLVGGFAANPRMPSLRAAEREIYGGRRDRLEADVRVKVDAGPEFDTRVESVATRTVAGAAEPIMAGAQQRTMRDLRRPDLPGGFG